MQLSPADKTLVAKFTLAAKKIIYHADRAAVLCGTYDNPHSGMMGSKPGALQAVHTVLAIIEKHKHIPPQIVHQLGVNIYLVLVDMCQEIHKVQADPTIIKDVVSAIMHSVDLVHQSQKMAGSAISKASQSSRQEVAQPRGIIAGQIGAAQ